ncbi:MAG: ABC transporter ATP-binding protein/permease [Rhodobacteraceae bacterium]|nr:ABC transporter ATP-binding protein/permease [Paracoccaceae bacterium]
MGQGVGAAKAALDLIIVSLGRDVLTLVGLVFVMVFQNPFLSVFAFLIMPPAILGVTFLVKRTKQYVKRKVVSSVKIDAAEKDTVLGIRTVKAFSLEPFMRNRVEVGIVVVQRQSNRIASLSARTAPLMDTLGGFAIAGVMFYGGFSVIELGQDPGALFSFITALLLAYDPAKRLARPNVNLGKNVVGLRMMYELVDREPGMKEIENAPDLSVSGGKIEFRDIVFSYAGTPALKSTNFVAESRTMTALVGASGAGKSTVFSLIERFYDPDTGDVLIDNQTLPSCNLDSVRQSIAYVGQDPFLFELSVRENIAVGKPGATQEEIEAAAKAANAHDFIMNMPKGYDSSVGQGGNKLSGGQRRGLPSREPCSETPRSCCWTKQHPRLIQNRKPRSKALSSGSPGVRPRW